METLTTLRAAQVGDEDALIVLGAQLMDIATSLRDNGAALARDYRLSLQQAELDTRESIEQLQSRVLASRDAELQIDNDLRQLLSAGPVVVPESPHPDLPAAPQLADRRNPVVVDLLSDDADEVEITASRAAITSPAQAKEDSPASACNMPSSPVSLVSTSESRKRSSDRLETSASKEPQSKKIRRSLSPRPLPRRSSSLSSLGSSDFDDDMDSLFLSRKVMNKDAARASGLFNAPAPDTLLGKGALPTPVGLVTLGHAVQPGSTSSDELASPVRIKQEIKQERFSSTSPVPMIGPNSEGKCAYPDCTSCATIPIDIPAVNGQGCAHAYCQDCLETQFRMAIEDETGFPPKCCHGPLPFEAIKQHLTSGTAQAFEFRQEEMFTPDKTYRAVPKCGKWIHPRHIEGDVATCGECRGRTCTMCKAAAHYGDCPQDKGVQQVLETAKKEGWQRCEKCRNVVEREYGCNHMR
ncbi:Hypothetical protein D9617_9g025780 [Elsinoe fawcettii]|nr:Hypothetical protein D9617_9g025780 [Elsinoe fawcettii]